MNALESQINTIIADLDRARANGAVYTYGNIQERLRNALRLASRKPEAAPSDTDRDFKRIPSEVRAELIHMAEGRIKDVWADSPEGVDAATLAGNVVAAQEFVWMQLAAGVDLRTSRPVQVEVTEGTRAAREFLQSAIGESEADAGDEGGGSGWDVEVDARTVLRLLDSEPVTPVQVEVTDWEYAVAWDDMQEPVRWHDREVCERSIRDHSAPGRVGVLMRRPKVHWEPAPAALGGGE